MKGGGWCCLESSKDHSVQLAIQAVCWPVGIYCSLLADFSQWSPLKHIDGYFIRCLSIGYFINFRRNTQECPFCWLFLLQGLLVCQMCHSDDCMSRRSCRNKTHLEDWCEKWLNYWFGEELAVNERPVFHLFSNNNLPVVSVDPRRGEESVLCFVCCSNFQKSTCCGVTKTPMILLPG